MKWIILFVAGLLEVGWAIGLKYSEGFTKLVPSIFTIVSMGFSVYFLSLAIKELPLGTAYAIWTGIGTLGTVIIGGIVFKDNFSIPQIICILVLVSAIIGLKVLSPK